MKKQKPKRNSKHKWRIKYQKRASEIKEAQILEANLKKWFAFLLL